MNGSVNQTIGVVVCSGKKTWPAVRPMATERTGITSAERAVGGNRLKTT